MDDSLTLTLRSPVDLGPLHLDTLTLTEPTVDQLTRAMKAGSGPEQTATLIALNANVALAAVQKMKQRDFQDAARFFRRFEDAAEGT